MTDVWLLPVSARIAGREYGIYADFRDILEIFSYLDDPDLPETFRWRIALTLFYKEPIPAEAAREAMDFLARFLCGGETEQAGNAPRLLDWQQDASLIVADVNKVAGQEIRALPFVHWWTFLAWFHAISQGQLSTVVAIRDKLRRGLPLEGWEKDFYRENKGKVDLKKRYSSRERARQEELKRLLDG